MRFLIFLALIGLSWGLSIQPEQGCCCVPSRENCPKVTNEDQQFDIREDGLLGSQLGLDTLGGSRGEVKESYNVNDRF